MVQVGPSRRGGQGNRAKLGSIQEENIQYQPKADKSNIYPPLADGISNHEVNLKYNAEEINKIHEYDKKKSDWQFFSLDIGYSLLDIGYSNENEKH